LHFHPSRSCLKNLRVIIASTGVSSGFRRSYSN